MKRIPLSISENYIAALSERLGFDLSPKNLLTKAGKAYILKKAAFVSQISEGLTLNREKFLQTDYLKDPEISEAYLLYFMTTNLLKIIQPLQELELSGIFDTPKINVLDFGTGTGAAMWGLIEYLRLTTNTPELSLTLTDSLDENLHSAEKFGESFIPKYFSGTTSKPKLGFSKYDVTNPTVIPRLVKDNAPYHLITGMNVLNELDEAADALLLESFNQLLDSDGAMVFIEPANRDQSRRLLRFRDTALLQGHKVFSPCTMQLSCPALVSTDDWCHHNTAWERPAFIKAIDDATGLLRLSLKYSYLIIRKDGKTMQDVLGTTGLMRTVSERFDEKGRTRAILCGETGRAEYVVNKRDKSPVNGDFFRTERYDLLSVGDVEAREHDRRITDLSPISIMLPKLGAR
ncbi:MAG: small ribosomal subunit Rsm22 family protein [bacterium]